MDRRDVDLIVARIQPLFAQRRNTRYWLLIANDPYDHAINFFFNQQSLGHRLKSTPLHSATGDLSELEQVISALGQHFQFSIEYTGFTGMRWPSTWHLIEKKKESGE
ncbi:acetyl-CoA carboxylase [Lacticaseibacillus mingshuiensis]|uniref:Acetyl-CoA carboxylase n=1 Tax=Lacticaseibacillus mingshuiensis TaxID=2799574 RepID=A0ABW4CIU7_9LACO|nr:acetyl-CoA carboxylase [Lacticaseibacillus mingshuiensis]